MAIIARIAFAASALLWAGVALAGSSWLVSGPPQILGVTLDNEYFTGSPTPGTTIGTLTVQTTGASFGGTLTLGGPNASNFTLTGSTLTAATTLSPGIDYSLTVTPSGSFAFPVHVYGGVTRYISPTGSDVNDGLTSGTPWLTVNHPMHCADVMLAATGSYTPQHLGSGAWGVVSCPNNDNVAWLKCASTLHTCLVSGDYQNLGSVSIDSSYWGVQGFEATDSGAFGGCFGATPRFNNISVHHIVFANSIANTCPLSGFGGGQFGGSGGVSSVDYMMFVGDLVWNGAASAQFCGSAFTVPAPKQVDSYPGPHFYWGLNIGVSTVAGLNCVNGGVSGGESDGQGLILDRWDIFSYTSVVSVENNLFLGNGGPGFHEFILGSSFPANVMFRFNTLYGNNTDPGECAFTIGELWSQGGIVTAINNIFASRLAVKPCGYTVYPQDIDTSNPQTLVDLNWIWDFADPTHTSVIWANGHRCATGPSMPSPGAGNPIYGALCPGTTVADPLFTAPSVPGQWFCSGFADTQACAATVIAGFVPTATGASAYGFNQLAPTDQWNSTPFFKNIMHALPAALNPHGF